MYQEDEPLPPFVHRFHFERRASKGMSQKNARTFDILTPTTQRMETPVLYFYGKPHPKVRVQVDFPQGIVSEWYPKVSKLLPSRNNLSAIEKGTAIWDISLSKTPGTYLDVPEDSIWRPSRQVDALTVTSDQEQEPLIFYRGLGSFTLPVKVTTDAQGALHIKNEGDLTLPHVFIFKNVAGKQKLYDLGALEPGKERQHGETAARPSPKESPKTFRVERAKAMLASALQDSGLLPKEATAMVNTWERSYFQTPGIRVLYVLPRAWTDKLLPLTITPKPDQIERVLLGRIEALQPRDEAALLASLQSHYKAKERPNFPALGPFLMPRMRRIHADTSDPDFKSWLGSTLRHYHRNMTAYRRPSP